MVGRRFVLALALVILGSPIPASAEPATRHAKDFYDPDLPTCGIQEAINALPKKGGRVVLEARTYVLRAPIVLRDDLTVSGQGRDTVLKRRAEVIHELTVDARQGERTITVGSTAGLRVGDQVAVRDDEFNGWHTTHGVVTALTANSVVIDHDLVKPYAASRNAVVVNHHPMVSALRIWDYRYRVRRWVVEDLTVDGNLAENPTPISDWSTAAIHLASTADGVVQRCVVRDWVTDGISDQHGRFNVIRDCLVERCRGNGFHPGTSTRGSRFVNNTARDNAGDGFFFCAGVTGVQVSNNTFVGNKRDGIGGLGSGGDSFNVVSGNVCAGNGRHGIQADDGKGNAITGNACFGNSVSEPGRFAGIALEGATDVTVTGNTCGNKPEGDEPVTQGYGIVESGASDRNVITGNVTVGNTAGAIVTAGAATVASGNPTSPDDKR